MGRKRRGTPGRPAGAPRALQLPLLVLVFPLSLALTLQCQVSGLQLVPAGAGVGPR